ncbi:hypothetical protein [Streptomyces sp. NPDC059209]|uniref:hypothetical protein n=1 Tax=Streptomyces sp. NPDC059209 TaxID=3346769 RepID=UPI0036BF8520
MRDLETHWQQLASPEWSEKKLSDLPGVDNVTYGIVEPGPYCSGGVPLLQAGGIADGRLRAEPQLRITTRIHEMHHRTWLSSGDVVLVVVGRFGEAAVVDWEHSGWNAARSVGVVKINEAGHAHRIGQWIRFWLRTPHVREWCESRMTKAAQSTLGIRVLRQLPVPLPPRSVRERILDRLEVIDQKIAVNDRIAVTAVELADARFRDVRDSGLGHEISRCGEVADIGGAVTDVSAYRVARQLPVVAHVAPQEILQSSLPYLVGLTGRTTVDPGGRDGVPGLLVATKPGVMKVLRTMVPAVPKRGAVAVRPRTEEDGLWLLHELRASGESLLAQDRRRQTRELSRAAFSRTSVTWPDADVREDFGRVVGPLHGRAVAAMEENHVLATLAETTVHEMKAAGVRSLRS